MGLFDFIESAIEKTVEKAVESVVRLPEIPVKVFNASVEGVEKGLDKLGEALDNEKRS